MKVINRGDINFYHCDNMELMKSKPDNYYDLAIVDPPYGIGEDGKKNHSRGKYAKAKLYTPKKWDNKPPPPEYFKELKRVSKNQIIWGSNHFIENIPKANSSCWIVWNKKNGDNDFSDCELAYSSFNTAVRIFDFRWAGMLQQNMKKKEKRIHPTQKPVDLYRWVLQKYATKGNKILDTHGGSFTHAKAADMEGFELDICELDEEYFNNGLKEFDRYKLQLTIF